MSDLPMNTFRDCLPGIVYGGDYNPEQWPREVWREDVELMRAANVRLVNLGVFSWSALESADGEFQFGWLDEIMDLLAGGGISVNLATPNASPPPWLAEDFPETLMVERSGVRVGVGGRGHFCPSSEVYRDRSRRIARELAERYRDHPALAMWHVGNEYHALCFCDRCDERFRGWLREKYGSLDELNRRWGTLVWGQRYNDWPQVHLPRSSRGMMNPARELDFARFNSAIQLELYTAERDLLKAVTPQVPVTTNFMQFFRLNDYQRWAPEVDVVAFDIYPDPADPEGLVKAALQYDLMRSLRGGEPWMVMEQAAGAVSQWPFNLVKQPGRMRLGSYQAVAHGADAIMFFQWRQSRYGQEKFHSAMLTHGGQSTRSWQAVLALGNELDRVAGVATARTSAEVAIVWDWENWWAVEGCAHPVNTYSYKDTVVSHYRALWAANVAVDVVNLSQDLSQYRVLVVPNQYLMSQDQQDAVRRFVENGGHAVVSYFSGIVNEDDQVIPDGYPGGLRQVIGGHVREFSPLASDTKVTVRAVDGQELVEKTFTATATGWQDDLVAESGQVIAEHADGYLAGQPAVLDNSLGAGRAVYLGTRLDQPSLETLVRAVLGRAGVRPVHAAPAGVEVTERRTGDRTFLFILNHGDDKAILRLDRRGTDLLTGQVLDAGHELVLEPAGVVIVESPLS
ncbi:beta-galactosidase [Nonomuraea sp. NPDC049158]|uniref:beta-galactosidase n=1 Tax=Nonomuraea sp. NPDC049158 TaxID=3155649 RepID=UPI0033F3A0B3